MVKVDKNMEKIFEAEDEEDLLGEDEEYSNVRAVGQLK